MTAARRFLDSVLYSYAQILFSNRRWYGAVLLVATFLHPECGALALAGVILSNLIAYLLKFDANRIASGFYGFNGILFGAAYAYYFTLSPFLLALFPVFLLVAFMFAAALEHYLAVAFNLPGMSLPFVIALYITLIFFRNYPAITLATHALAASPGLEFLPLWMARYFQSFALLFFQTNVLAGILIVAGLLVFSRVLFVLSVTAFALNALIVQWLLPDKPESFLILSGLNAILIAIALGGSLVIPSRKSFALAMVGVLMAVVFTGFFSQIAAVAYLPVVVLPFNFVVLGTLYSLKFRQRASELVLLYFLPGSPEENYYYHHTSQSRFARLQYLAADLPVSGEWLVSQGHDGPTTHREAWRHAWDFVVVGEDGRTYQNGGTSLESFHCYRLPVRAALSGEVVQVEDSVPDNKIGEVNLAQNWGNTIVLKHAEGFFSAVSHLCPGTARVTLGAHVQKGEILALCGNSGRSPEPHLHFQFQPAGMIGGRTISHPIAHFYERRNGRTSLRVSASPDEDSRVQNLMDHSALKTALAFPLGSTYRFQCQPSNDPSFEETWEVKVDAANSIYVESSAGAVANLLPGDHVFYVADFHGSKRSALYHFYLCALQIPLAFQEHAHWHDVLPLGKVYSSPARALSELLLLFGSRLHADADFSFSDASDPDGSLVIRSDLRVSGNGLFAAVRRSRNGELRISHDGAVASFALFESGRNLFTAKNV
jgi:urea transporter